MTRKTRKRRKKLNEARLDVWGKHLSNDDNTKMSERIIELDMREELSTKEEKELSMLLKMEASLLSKSGEEVQKNKNVISEYYKCLDKISKDERLTVLFNVRFGDAMSEELVKTPEDVNKIFHKMMVEDMEIDGHDKLKKEFKEIKKYLDSDVDPLDLNKCNDPECLYCSELDKEELDFVMKRLDNEGYLDSKYTEETKVIMLMAQIIRLEMLIDDLEDDEEDD